VLKCSDILNYSGLTFTQEYMKNFCVIMVGGGATRPLPRDGAWRNIRVRS